MFGLPIFGQGNVSAVPADIHSWYPGVGMGGLTADIVQAPPEPLEPQAVLPIAEKAAKPSIITQQGNPYNLFGAIPIHVGKNKRFYPYVSANGWNSYREGKNNNDYYLGLDWGYGPVKIEEIKVGEIPIDDLASEKGPGRPAIEYELRETIDDDEVTIVPYDTETKQIAKELKHNDAQIERAPQCADLIIIGLEFPSGLYTSGGEEPSDATVEFKFEYREVDNPDYTLWTAIDNSWEYTVAGAQRILKGYEWEPPDNTKHYEVRVTRKSPVTTDGSKVDGCNWFNLEAILYNEPYPQNPLDAYGEECIIARLGLKAVANDQVQGALDPINGYVQALVPHFRDGFGLTTAHYPVDDAPPPPEEPEENPNEITDTGGQDHHGTLYGDSNWQDNDPNQDWLLFEGNSYILAPTAIFEPASLVSGHFEGFFSCTGDPTGNLETSRRPIFNVSRLTLYYDPEVESIYLQGKYDEICRSDEECPPAVMRYFELDVTSDGTNLLFELRVYATGIDQYTVGTLLTTVTGSDTLSLYTIYTPSGVNIGRSFGLTINQYHGVLHDIAVEFNYPATPLPGTTQSGTIEAHWPMDDSDIEGAEGGEETDPNEITDTEPGAHHGTRHGLGTWTEIEPYRLNFEGLSYISLPLPVVIDTESNPDTLDHGYISGKFIAEDSDTVNPILSLADNKLILWQEPDTEDVVLYIGLEEPIEIRLTDVAPLGEERHFLLHLFVVGSGANAAITIYDDADLELAQDGDAWEANDFVDVEEILIGSGLVPEEEEEEENPNEITDTGGQDNHGTILVSGEASWTEDPPYRLNFDGRTHILMPVLFNPLTLESGTIEFFMVAPEPETSYNAIFEYRDIDARQKTNGDIEVSFDNVTLKVDDCGFDLQRKVSISITRNAPNFDLSLSVYDETDTLIGTDTDTIALDDFENIATILDLGKLGSRLFFGQIYDFTVDFQYPSDVEVVANYPIDDNVAGPPPNTLFTGQIWDVDVRLECPPLGGVTEDSTTSNPALLALYLMRSPTFNPRPVPDEKIDFLSFYKWSLICEEKEYEYNTVIDQPTVLWNALEDIGRAGRAMVIRKGGIYIAAVDISATHDDGPKVVQTFNRANSSGFKMVTNRDYRTHAWRINWLDPSDDNNQGQVIAFAKYSDITYSSTNATRYKVADAKGITTREGAKREGRRLIAEEYYRSTKQYELTTDWEGLLCTKNDLVHVSNSAGLIGITGGYITELIMDGGDVVGIKVDQGCTMEVGKTYQVHLREQLTSTPIIREVVNDGAGLYYELELETGIYAFDHPSLEVGSLFCFGEEDKVTRLMRVSKIERMTDHNARLLLDEYHENLFDFEAEADVQLDDFDGERATLVEEYRRTMPTITLSPIFNYNPLVAVATWHDYVSSPDERAAIQTWWREVGAGPSYTPEGDWQVWIQTPANFAAAVTQQTLVNGQWYEVKAKPIVKDGRIGEFSNSVYAMALVDDGEGGGEG
ncbi:MAG: phage tail protein [Candidatus Obscuribacterales bacterium]|nr:phage tail protein [Candidatus Obscuribacterales bacterium]